MFAIVFQQVLIMFLLMLIGFIYAKATGMRKEECNRICNILLMIVTPCLLLSNSAASIQHGNCGKAAFFSGLAAFSSIFSILAARFLFLPRGQEENKRIERYGASFGNVGFIGIPLVTGIFGEEYAVFAVVFVVMFHVFSWTVGVGILKGSFREMSWKEALLNPGVLQCSGSCAAVYIQSYAAFAHRISSRLSFFLEYALGHAGMRFFYCRSGLEAVS